MAKNGRKREKEETRCEKWEMGNFLSGVGNLF